MTHLIQKLLESQYLDQQQAQSLMHGIAGGALNEAQMAAVLTAYVMRNVSLDELTGFRQALLELALKPQLNHGETMDLCGTGGDGKNTFNISTLSAFVVAACGIPVAKHGNYGISSRSGSSNVMEYLGYQFPADESQLQYELEKAGICFMHAPLFHPALKAVGGVRRQLGMKSFFNILGPLVNPASPRYQVSGVFNLETGRIYSYLLQQEQKKFRVVHCLQGYDEVSLTGEARIFSPQGESMIRPEDFGLSPLQAHALDGGNSIEAAAGIFVRVLNNQGTREQNHAVMANAALAIQCYHPSLSLTEAVEQARESIVSGKALKTFQTLLAINNKHRKSQSLTQYSL